MTSTHFKKQEQMIFLKAQREEKRFHQKQTSILINEAWRSKDSGYGVFIFKSKEENDFHKQEKKIILKTLLRKRFFFQNKHPLKKRSSNFKEGG